MFSDETAVMTMWLFCDVIAASLWVGIGAYVFGSSAAVPFVRMLNVVGFVVVTAFLAANPLPRWLWTNGAHVVFLMYCLAPIVILCIAVGRDWTRVFMHDYQRRTAPRIVQQSATALQQRQYQDAIDTVWGEVIEQRGPQPRALHAVDAARRAIMNGKPGDRLR